MKWIVDKKRCPSRWRLRNLQQFPAKSKGNRIKRKTFSLWSAEVVAELLSPIRSKTAWVAGNKLLMRDGHHDLVHAVPTDPLSTLGERSSVRVQNPSLLLRHRCLEQVT